MIIQKHVNVVGISCYVGQGETGYPGFAYVTPFDNPGNYFVIHDGSNEAQFYFELQDIKDILKVYAAWYDMGLCGVDSCGYSPEDFTAFLNLCDFGEA